MLVLRTPFYLLYHDGQGSLPYCRPRQEDIKGKPAPNGWDTCCFLMNLRKETGAERDSLACSSTFIMPLPPDPRPLLGGRARVLGIALLMCHSQSKCLVMEGLKWYVKNPSAP